MATHELYGIVDRIPEGATEARETIRHVAATGIIANRGPLDLAEFSMESAFE